MAAPDAPVSRRSLSSVFAPALFVVLLAVNLWAVLAGWTSELLQGNEFRQSQTALTTFFVQRDHDFSLAYPTPVLGKPWSIPMEFPLYQWTVAVVSSATGAPLIQSGRAVSYACFLLCLPAVWLLLGELAVPRASRFVVLAPLLTSPLYIFYARAFLIETMALGFSLWFLVAYVAALRRRRVGWLVVANLAGLGAGLVKVTTFLLYLAPAAGFSVFLLWQIFTTAPEKKVPLARALAWMLAAVALPCAASVAWIHFADAHKILNPGGASLASSTMNTYHFGTWAIRADGAVWRSHWHTLTTNITPLAALGVFLVALAGATASARRWSLLAVGLFAAAPFTFPILYSWHEYYFVANAALLLLALGLAAASWLDTPRPRWLVWPLILSLSTLQLTTWARDFYPSQRIVHEGGTSLTRMIRDMTEPNDVVVIAGQDWNSALPFYAERRALMIRRSFEHDATYLERAFRDLRGESVTVLVLSGPERDNHDLLQRAVQTFDLDPRPFATNRDQTLYVSRLQRAAFAQRLTNIVYDDTAFADPAERLTSPEPQPVTRSTRRFFSAMSPMPTRYQVPFGLAFRHLPGGVEHFDAHASSRLWFTPPPGAHRVSLAFGVIEEAFTRENGRSDGVEFTVEVERPDGSRQKIFSRFLDPATRGLQTAEIPLPVGPIAQVIVATGPGPSGSNAFDWAYLARCEIL